MLGILALYSLTAAPPPLAARSLEVAAPARCATQVEDPTLRWARETDILDWSSKLAPMQKSTISVPIAFHIIMDDRGVIGQVSDQQIDDQIDVLNDAFAPCGVEFNLHSIERYQDSSCVRMQNERECKAKYQKDPHTLLNFYTTNILRAWGWAYFPWTLDTMPVMDGVVLHYGTLPEGSAPYNLGMIPVHEVGHWTGLYHTFQGGCQGPGDHVDDTPAQADASSGCPFGRDSCPQDGIDPIHNFMDYSDDTCMEAFTGGQCERLRTMFSIFRTNYIGTMP